MDAIPEEYSDVGDTEIANSEVQYPQASERSQPFGAVIMQEFHMPPPPDHVSQLTKASRASKIGQGVGTNVNAHQVAADIISNAVKSQATIANANQAAVDLASNAPKSQKTIASGEQPQADVFSKYANSLASKKQPQGAKPGQLFRAGERLRSKEKRTLGGDRSDKSRSKSIKRTGA